MLSCYVLLFEYYWYLNSVLCDPFFLGRLQLNQSPMYGMLILFRPSFTVYNLPPPLAHLIRCHFFISLSIINQVIILVGLICITLCRDTDQDQNQKILIINTIIDVNICNQKVNLKNRLCWHCCYVIILHLLAMQSLTYFIW